MVRVTKRGKVPDTTFRGTCHNCKSELEEDRKNVHPTHDQRNGDGWHAAVTCPVCGRQAHLYSENI